MACEEIHGAFTLTCSSGPDRPAGRRPRWRPACASTSGAAVRPGPWTFLQWFALS